jgi:hypothetical protein
LLFHELIIFLVVLAELRDSKVKSDDLGGRLATSDFDQIVHKKSRLDSFEELTKTDSCELGNYNGGDLGVKALMAEDVVERRRTELQVSLLLRLNGLLQLRTGESFDVIHHDLLLVLRIIELHNSPYHFLKALVRLRFLNSIAQVVRPFLQLKLRRIAFAFCLGVATFGLLSLAQTLRVFCSTIFYGGLGVCR